jgi:hypothetical protein
MIWRDNRGKRQNVSLSPTDLGKVTRQGPVIVAQPASDGAEPHVRPETHNARLYFPIMRITVADTPLGIDVHPALGAINTLGRPSHSGVEAFMRAPEGFRCLAIAEGGQCNRAAMLGASFHAWSPAA